MSIKTKIERKKVFGMLLPEWMDEDIRRRFQKLYEIQEKTKMTLTQMGLRFLLAEADIVTVIPGPANVAQLQENIDCSMAGRLPAELHAELDVLGKIVTQTQW